jgi:hypothetical protein
MAKLVANVPGVPAMHFDLPPGLHQVGRSPQAHFQINHPSVSSLHCQIAVEREGASITDLGSTNGTWIDGQRIQHNALLPGQRLRLGEVDVVFDPQAAPVPAPEPGLHLASKPSAAVAAFTPASPPLRPRLAADQPVAQPTGTFYQSIPGAFAYPLKNFGILTLAVGSVFFLAFNVLPRLGQVAEALFFPEGDERGMGSLFQAAFGGLFFGIGSIFNVLVTGYVFLFMQTVVSASANGEDRMPLYPGYENWWYDAVEPYLRLICLLACCLAPAVLCRSFLGPDFKMLTQFLGILGFCYFSMALLAVSVCDSLAAMTPNVVIPSICRIPVEYAVYCLMFVVLTGVMTLSARWILESAVVATRNPFMRSPFASDPYGIYRLFAVEFVFLYFTVVEMRLLGLLYLTGREKLGWKL